MARKSDTDADPVAGGDDFAQNQEELAALRSRVAELEAQNRALAAGGPAAASTPPPARRPRRWRTPVSVVAIVLAAVLVPIAVLGTWIRVQLIDTDTFVATFAPLADDPAVQSFVADQAITAINDNVDINSMIDNAFDGLSQLNLPSQAKDALGLLRVPAQQGVQSLIDQAVNGLVASPAFADIWEQALRQAHSRAIAIIQGQPGTAIDLDQNGTLSINLGVVVEKVKAELQKQGVGIADMIPQIDKTIPITTSDSFVLIRSLYQVAVAAGYWLGWVVLGLVAVGIAVARNRGRAVAWIGAGFAISLLLLAAGLGTGRLFFVGSVSPSLMPAATANVVFHQVTGLMVSTIAALVMLSVLVMIGGWLAGRSSSAQKTRGAVDGVFGHARRFFDAQGMDTRGFGRWLDRWRVPVMIAVVVIATLAVFATRPVTTAAVVIAVVCIVVAVILIELLRRPPAEAGDQAPAVAYDETHEH
ncbi:hypothetical protein [Microbacterium sp.]|uniref:hypothetical protein n=1 Tax=Microbacterium sp. TaxID=51671 RepID=UPI003A915806